MPRWLLEHVDKVVDAYGNQIRSLTFSPWIRKEYNDNNSYETIGSFWIDWLRIDAAPSQDELDHLPSMRKLERCADEVWTFLPLDCDSEGDIVGDVYIGFERSGFRFSWNRTDHEEPSYFISADWTDAGAWKYKEEILLPNPQLTETARASLDNGFILDEISPDAAGLSCWPEVRAVEFDENDDLLITVAPRGLLNFERKNA